MTIGEKIRNARKECGLTQERLAEKLSVSRSAVAKWESDIGIPDVDNLRLLSDTLGISVDYLLNSDKSLEQNILLCEPYVLSEFGKGSKKAKKDRVIRQKYPGAVIYTLLAKVKLQTSEKVIDNLLGFFTDAPFGIPELINELKNLDKQYYLVEENGKHILSLVTDERVESRPLSKLFTEDTFEIGNIVFIKCKKTVK